MAEQATNRPAANQPGLRIAPLTQQTNAQLVPQTRRKPEAAGDVDPRYPVRPVLDRQDIRRTISKPSDTKVVYWSVNRWGVPGKPQAQPRPGSPEAKRARKHYQSPSIPITPPDASVFATLNDLENLMRATLGAVASFNEDERMILTKQFRQEEVAAGQRGEYLPPGLMALPHFRHVWKRLGVRVTREQAAAMFIRHGCDAQGLLPYDLFATKLLSSPARLLALEPEQRGAFKPGQNANFKGKIMYKPCRKPVFPPSAWDGTAALRSARPPRAGLRLEHVYGYDGFNSTATNVAYNAQGRIVYYVAALGVVYDPATHTQRFFQGHDDDVRCMSMHPERKLVATGQVASALDGSYAAPYVCVWDSTTEQPSQVRMLKFSNEDRLVVALGFSGNGERLVCVMGDNRHTVYVYDWARKQLLSRGVGHNGQPPQVFGVVWNPHTISKDVVGCQTFVTYGVKHIKFWLLDAQMEGGQAYKSMNGRFGKAQVGDVMSAVFLPKGYLVTGGVDGTLLIWDTEGTRGGYGNCIKVIEAHGPGRPAPGIHDGQMMPQGVRVLCLRQNATEMVSGGADGQLLIWDITSGALGRTMRSIMIQNPGEKAPPVIRGLDCRADGLDIIVGTSHCDIWEVNRNVPEPLVQGSTGDLYGITWHPRKPYKFATACESTHVFLWNARRRQLIAKRSIGLPVHAVAFSPNGAHLAVATSTGAIRVLMVEDLSKDVAQLQHSKEAIDVLKYSPDNTKLAAGSHDNFIDIFNVIDGYQRIARCSGHSSYITQLDWSADSRVIMSNDGAFELLYWDAATGKQVKQNQRDMLWDTWTCVLGFPVMGIWQDGSDGTDINAVERSHALQEWRDEDPLAGEGEYCVTSGDDGRVRLFHYPCVIDDAPCRTYKGHSSHVLMVRFAPNNRYVVSVGGRDRAVFQWRVDAEAVVEVVEKPEAPAGEVFVYQAPQKRLLADDPLADAAQLGTAGMRYTPLQTGPGPPGAAAGAGGKGGQVGVDGQIISAAEAAQKRKEEEEQRKKELERVYEVTVVTSDLRGAGTDANVFLVMHGTKGHTAELRLDSAKENFERARKDVFTLRHEDIGDITHIRIGHDNTGDAPGWHLESVTIINRSEPTPKALFFPCGLWFDKDEGDRQIVRVLHPGKAPANGPRKYKVVVKTSDLKGAGTDANVMITLCGANKDSGAIKLENSKNNFEKGQTDVFEIETNVHEVQYIRIGHDNSGLGPSWHLQEVLLSSAGLPDMQFPANRWLATNEGDGKTQCTLYPAGGAGAAPKLHRYRVHIFTSDIKGAGTDANVFLVLYGAGGRSSGELKPDTSKNNFERGAEDIFFFELPEMGDITEVEVGHDNKGFAPGWHCEQVVVVDEVTNKRYVFQCDRWLAKDEDDGLIRRRLKVMDGASGTTSYRVTTYTSDLRGAGTDANVYIELIGEKNGREIVGPKTVLDNSSNNFERARADTFLLKKQASVGRLTKIRIGHDNKGIGPGWHLDHVEVVDDADGKMYYIPANTWFARNEGDKLIERVLPVAVPDAAAAKCAYKISTYTSDIRFAGTDANVFIDIQGERDGQPTSSGRVKLDNSKNNFERGATDVFNVTLPNLGTIKSILIGHDNKGLGGAWHLNKVEVFSVNTGQTAQFYYNGWLSTNEPPYKLEMQLFPVGDGEKPALTRYKVTTYTSDLRGAGTDANVTCVIIGDKGQTPVLPLDNSKNNFERGQRDEFVVEANDVGKIAKLQIGHDNKGLGPAWHLQHVEVQHQGTGERAFFVADQWLDAKSNTLTVTLEPSTAASAKQKWKVTVKTADKRGAGTDADVSVILIGDKAQSQEIKLDNSSNNFERNKEDEFLLDLGSTDLGELQKLDIGFATQQSAAGLVGGIFGKQWALLSVEAVNVNTGSRQFFMFDDWISNTKRRVQLTPGKIGENNTYKVVVKTSDIRGAGTDSNVSLQMFGVLEGKPLDSGTHKLDNSANNFERNMTDNFTITCKDLGTLTRVVVTSDGTGLGPGWHLDQIEIFDTNRGTSSVFPCGRWFDARKDPASLQQTLLAAGAGGAAGDGLVQYEVLVATSDIRGAGTDSNVTIELVGDKGTTGALKLDNSANNFERNMRDTFKLLTADVGKLSEVIIRKDASGLGEAWHLHSVEVFHPGLQQRYYFVCNDWIKGKAERRLAAGQAGGAAGGLCNYRLTVYTSDIRGAGTDADVTATLYGANGDTGERKLDNSANNFERGKADQFYIQAPDLGELQALRISHNNRGLGPAWHLAKVEVVNMATGLQAVFPYNEWLDKQKGISQLLYPDVDGDGKGDKGPIGALVDYTVSVHTSDIRGAGTDANVTIEMHGSKGFVGESKLDNASNNFERGRTDTFKISGSDIGDVSKIIIKHDNSGLGPEWHLQQVEVQSSATGKTYYFPCNDWLKKTKEAGLEGCRKELSTGSPDAAGPTSYKVMVHTSDLRGAGTDSDVFLTIYGTKGDTGERKLDNSANNFERKKIDTFFITSGNVGDITHIKVRSTGTGIGAAWHLSKVEVLSSALGTQLTFPYNNWIDKKNGLEHILHPDVDGDGKGDVIGTGTLVDYRISVYTSDIRGAGTDANVSIEINGDKGFIGATRLDNAANNFERGRKDEFEIKATDVGEIQSITIGHDNSGILQGASWHLQQVEIYHAGLQRTYVFPCNQWLQHTKEAGLDGCKRTLTTGAPGAGGPTSYKVLVATSDLRGAGTDSDVFLTIYGTKGDTGERKLDNSANNFERGKVDTFFVLAPDIGEVERCKVRSTGTGIGAPWHLAKIEVIPAGTGTPVAFPFNSWIDRKNGLEHMLGRDKDGDGVADQDSTTALVDFRISVYTSDIRGAGTDANVFIEMHGSAGSVGQTRLENGANNFERGRADQFVVKATNIGDVNKIVIWHDNKGLGPDWHLRQVEVFNPATQKTYHFVCNDWLRKTREAGLDGCRRELLEGAAGAADGKVVYKVAVSTSDLRGAATDADVSITVYGPNGDTGEQLLESSANQFERNKTDTFFIKAHDIGPISSCKVVCSGKGLGAAWHLANITVTNTATGDEKVFPYNDWFDAKKGWTQVLYPDLDGDGKGDKTRDLALIEYEVAVYTSDLRGAATDGDVYIEMKGETGAIGRTKLENDRNNFQRNRKDVFTITGSEVGKFMEVTVELVPKGFGAAWHLQQIEVLNKRTGAKALFVYNDWLEKSKKRETLHITLPEASSEAAKATQTKVQYKVTTKTSDIFGAGTDARVFLTVHGPSGLLGGSEIYLSNSKNNFERGQADVFFLDFPVDHDCGTPITKVAIERAASWLPASDWHLDMLELVDVSRNLTYRWRCGQWLSAKEGMRKEWSAEAHAAGQQQQLTLLEGPPGLLGVGAGGEGVPSGGDPYRLQVVTSNKFGAGTDGTVKLDFTDAAGTVWSPAIMQERNHFDRGQTDEFVVTSLSKLGEIKSCHVSVEGGGVTAAWHLDHILLTHMPSQRCWRFSLAQWVPKGGTSMPAVVERDVPLEAVSAVERTVDAPNAGDGADGSGAPPASPRKAPLEYELVVYTGNKFGAGTDSTVTVELQGSSGKAVHTLPQDRKFFNAKGVDTFRILVPDVGDVTEARVWTDGKGWGADWFLDKLVLTRLDTGTKWEFACNKWIKGGRSKMASLPATLLEAGRPPPAPPTPLPRPPQAGPATAGQQERPDVQRSPGADQQQRTTMDKPGAAPTQSLATPDVKALTSSASWTAEPTTEWQRFSTPHPGDPALMVTFYHNARTGQSVYEPPADYLEWEARHRDWMRRSLGLVERERSRR